MQYNAYSLFIQLDIRESINIVEDIVKQKIMDRKHLELSNINAIRLALGEEAIEFTKVINGVSNKTNNKKIEEIKEKYSVANRKEVLNSLL